MTFYLQKYHLSQPTLRREADTGFVGASSKKGKCAESPPTFIRGKCRKNQKRCGLWTLSVKGSRVVITHEEGISTPRVRHKGRQPLIKCANMTSICFIFPFTFLCLFMSFCIFYLFVVDKGVSLAPTYSSIVIRKSDLRSSLRTERWLSCFYPFFARYIVIEKKSFQGVGPFKQSFDFWK